MELEIFEALTAANVPADKARAAAASVKKEIDERYSLHATQLATRGDLADLKTSMRSDIADFKVDVMKWTIGSIFGAVALFAAITKIWH